MPANDTSEPPVEGERLLATRREESVVERDRVARDLREAGRARGGARAVAALRKPTGVVLAVWGRGQPDCRCPCEKRQASQLAISLAKRTCQRSAS